jgi:hypothetical protein
MNHHHIQWKWCLITRTSTDNLRHGWRSISLQVRFCLTCLSISFGLAIQSPPKVWALNATHLHGNHGNPNSLWSIKHHILSKGRSLKSGNCSSPMFATWTPPSRSSWMQETVYTCNCYIEVCLKMIHHKFCRKSER